jgi:TolB-like protein/DNA-binding SARP family transcriptional activator/Flp pilus assembly protein TadD
MSLSLKLFGQLEIRDGSGTALSLPTRKTRALLGYLAVKAGQPQPRERLMALLWSDRGEKQARQSLNHALRAIRKLGEKEDIVLLDSDGERVTLRGDVLESDVGHFRALLDDHPGESATLYTGPFLDGLSVPDPAFEEWLLATRSEFHRLACDALEAAATSDDATTAIDCLRRLLALDPLREDAHRRLMRLLHQSGDRAGALRQYQACLDVLNRELQVDPDTTTRALYEKIRRDSGAAVPVDPETAIDRAPAEHPSHTRQPFLLKTSPPFRWYIAVSTAVVLLVIGGVLTMWLAPRTHPADTAVGESTPLPQSDKPLIAVLPFSNMSGDEEQEYFSDGLTEDLLTDLSKISALTVISRTSTFAYKGKSPDIRALARELGVSHVIEGSVRKAGGRVRITAQLTETSTGASLWAERYDRELKDIFALQDEVRGKIVSALAVKLAPAEEKRFTLKGTESVEAYDLFLEGRHRESSFTREGVAEAIGFYEKAIAIDPGYANAYARMANMYDFTARFGWSNNAEGARIKALELAQRAIALDEDNPFAHWTQGRVISRLGSGGVKNQLKAISSLERAIELDPNYADAYAFISLLYVGIGRPNKALTAMESAMRLNPQYPFWYAQNRAIIRYMQGDYDAAIADLVKAAEQNPTAVFTRWWLAAAYAQAGQQDDADWQVEEMRVLGSHPTVKKLVISMSIIHHPPYKDRFAVGLRKAGIPD